MTTAKFWDRHAEGYAKKPVPDEQVYKNTLDCVKTHLSTNKTVLEIACGTGTTALILAEHAKHITATDFSPKMIEIAKRKIAENNTQNVTFDVATLEKNNFEDNAFDVVFTSSFLHLLQDVPTAIEKIHTLVKSGGLFISKSPCLAETKWWLKPLIYILRLLGFAPYVNFFKIKTLEKWIVDAGFEIIETRNFPSTPSRFIVAQKK